MFDFNSPTLLDLLEPADREFLASVGTRRFYRDGEVVHERGQRNFAMSVVAAGQVRFDRLFGDGKQIMLAMVLAGQNYGDQVRNRKAGYTHRATAIGETEIDHYSTETFSRLMELPAIVLALYRVAAFRLGQALELLNDVRALPPEVRVAKLLMSMRGSEGGADQLDCVQEDIASVLGMSSVTLTKALRTLKRRGLVETGYRQVAIADVTRIGEMFDEWDA